MPKDKMLQLMADNYATHITFGSIGSALQRLADRLASRRGAMPERVPAPIGRF